MQKASMGSLALVAAAAALVVADIFLVERGDHDDFDRVRRNEGGTWNVELSARARRERERYASLGMDRELAKIKRMLEDLARNPFENIDGFKFVSKLQSYTRDIDHRRRMTYTVDKAARSVYVTDLWSHNRSNG